MPISISTNITRATETAFESGDKVGLFVVNRNTDGSQAALLTTGNYVDNMLYTYTNVWTPATEIYWKDNKTHADFYLYYPYRKQVESVTAMPFSTKANQSAEADYKAGDLLVGSTLNAAPSTEAVRIEAKHIMSRVDIRLKPGAGFTESSLAAANVKVSLNNIKTSATVDLATATATATGQASAITPYNDGSAYHAIIVPQQVAQCNLITVNVNGRDFNLPKAFTFQSGKRHTFTVTLDKTSSGVNVTIGAWENDGNDNGGSAI
uniref:fimbrillin family protein n=1 Tax=Prevotella sp. TaxID=59823 RepID=UPI00402971DC